MSDDLINDSNSDSIAVYIQQSLQEVSNGLFKVLYALNSAQSSSRYLSQLSAAIQTIQMVGVLFALRGSVALVPWSQIHARPVIFFCSLVSESILDSLGLSDAAFQIALVLIGAFICGGIAIGWLIKKNNQIAVLLELYSVLTNLTASILFVPIIRVLVNQVVSNSTLSQFLGVIAFIPFVFFSICYKGAVFDMNPLSKSISARAHTRIDVLYAVAKIVLVIISVNSRSSILLSISAFVFSISVSYLLTMYLPYYDYRMMQYNAAFSWIFSWASLSAIVAAVYNNDSSGGAVFMLIGGIPVVVLSSYLIVQGRFDHLRATPISELKNPWEVQIRFRITLQDIDQNAMKTALLKQHKIQKKLETSDDPSDVVIELSDTNDDGIQSSANRADDFRECKAILVSSLARFPDSVHLLLAAASFQIDIAHIYFLAYIYLDQIAALHPKADERFQLYRIQRSIEERIFESESNTEIIQYNTQRDLLERAQSLDLKIVMATIDFWSEVLKSKPDDDKMRELAVQISNDSKTAYANYAKAIGISDDSVMAMQSYSGFLLTVLRDTRAGERLLERANEMQQVKSKAKQASVFKDLLFDDRAAVILISGNMRNFGSIIDCNLRAAQLLGFSKSILIGKSSRIFLPEPFASSHDSLMIRNLELGTKKMLDYKSNLVILHQSGFVQDVNIFVKAFVKDLSTLCFIGVIESTNPDLLIVVYDRSGVVTAISQTVALQFGINKDRIDSHDVHVHDLVPDVEAHHTAYRKAIASNPDYIRLISIEQDGTKYQMTIRFQTWNLLNDDFAVVLRMDIIGKQTFEDSESIPALKPLHPGLILEEVPIALHEEDNERSSEIVSRRSSWTASHDDGNNSQEDDTEAASDIGDDAQSVGPDEQAASSDPNENKQNRKEKDAGSRRSDSVHSGSKRSVSGRPRSRGSDQGLQFARTSAPVQSAESAPSAPDERLSQEPDIQPFYPDMTPKPNSKSRESIHSLSQSRSKKERLNRGSSEQSTSLISAATSNAGNTDANNDAFQKRLELTLMKWLHRAFISVFMMLAVLSLGQVFVANQIVTDFMAAIGIANFTGEVGMDVLRMADSVRVVDLISKGRIPDPDHSLTRQHFAIITKFATISGTCRNSLLDSRHGWDQIVFDQLSSSFPVNFCKDADCTSFDMTTLDSVEMFKQLATEIASLPVDRLDLLDQNALQFIIGNAYGLSEISNTISGFGAAAAREQNRLIIISDLSDLILQIIAALFLFLYAVRATVIGVQLRNDHALIAVFHVPNSAVNNIIMPYNDRLAILQQNDSADSLEQETRAEASFNVSNTLASQKNNNDSTKQKRLKRIESQIRKNSKFKTRRLIRYLFKFGQLIAMYAIFFSYRHIGIQNQTANRAPLPVRFQFGWRSGALLRRAVFNTRELMLVSADMLLTQNATNTTGALHASISADISQAEALRRSLTFGGVLDGENYPGALNAGPGHFELEFSSVCTIQDVIKDAPDCNTFSNGLALNGRQALFAENVRLIPQIISGFDAEITRIRSDPSFVPGVQARENFLRAQLASSDLALAVKIDNQFIGHTTRFFTHLLTDDRAQLAVDRATLAYTLISMVILINIYGYFGVVMSSLRDIAREFTQTQDLLKFVPIEIRQSISKDVLKSKSKKKKQTALVFFKKIFSFLSRQLHRVPLISTAALLGLTALIISIFTNPQSVWKSISSNAIIAIGTACDMILATWTPFGFGFVLTNLNLSTQAEEDAVRLACNLGQVAALCSASIMNAIMGRQIDWTLVILGTIGAICGNILAFFLADGIFDRDLVTLATVGLFVTFSLGMGIAQRYLSAKWSKKPFQNITGLDHVDIVIFGALAGIFGYLNGSSSGALFFLWVDCYFQMHFSITFPTCVLVGALDSLFMLGFHQVLGITFVDFTNTNLLNIILPIIFLSAPILCYFSFKSQGRYFKEFLVVTSVVFAVYVGTGAHEVGAWVFIYIFICTVVLWLPVCASMAVGGTIRSAAFEDI